MTKDDSLKRKQNPTALELYLLIECRTLILHLIGKDLPKFVKYSGINKEQLLNFIKYSYFDYVNVMRDKDKPFRYLTAVNCVRILEGAGYKLRFTLDMAD